MNILLINHYAGSDRLGMEFRPFYFAREWVACGHSTTILAADFSHLRGCQPDGGPNLRTTEEDGVRFRWLRTNRYVGNGPARVANILCFITRLCMHAGRIAREEQPDLVICSSTYPLDVYPGAWIARKAGAHLVFEVHDLWPLTPILLGGYSPRHPFIRLMQHAEDWAYRHADKVISILPHARDYMVGRGLHADKFVHIPNGVAVHPERVRQPLPEAIEQLIRRERAQGRFLIGYAGAFNLGMAVDMLLSSARLLVTDRISFLLAGDGPAAGALLERLADAPVDNFHLVGRIAKPLVPAFLEQMDALAVPWRRNPLFRFGVSPNKVFDYMLAGKPVLQASDASNDIIAAAACGFTVEPDNPLAFADAVRRLQALPHSQRQRLGENGRQFVLAHHDCRALAHRFLEAVTRPAERSATMRPSALRDDLTPSGPAQASRS